MAFQILPVIVVDFIAMAMPLADLSCAVEFFGQRTFLEYTRVCAEAECTSYIFYTDLIWMTG